VRFDVVVVGGGTAGCVLASRLSEEPSRTVCLLEAGPDYGAFVDGRWPAELLDATALPAGHTWPPATDDGRILGGRVLGGSSSVNACMVVSGSPADYDEWGDGWTFEELEPYLTRARETFRTSPWRPASPTVFQDAFADAAAASGLPPLRDPSDPGAPLGVARTPRNVVDGRRWNAAFAYLEAARGRPNLTVVADAVVDRVVLDGTTARGVVCADGTRYDCETAVLAAGAYFSPAILARSGIGAARELEALGIPVAVDLPVGARLLDHCGTDVAWELTSAGLGATAGEAFETGHFEAQTVAKAASSRCPDGTWDLHLLPLLVTRADGEIAAVVLVFHMKPLSAGTVRLHSTDPHEPPVVERGFLAEEDDVRVLIDGIELARTIARAEPLAGLVGAEQLPGPRDPEAYVRETVRNYFHPAGTCALGEVVDRGCRVLGTEGLLVADASVMPTIPRANTNLTTAAIAEKVAPSL